MTTPLAAAIVSNTEKLTIVHSADYGGEGTARPVLWLHHSGGDHISPWDPVNNSRPLLEAVCGLGLPIAIPNCGGPTTWGNDTAQTRATEALAYLRASKGAHPTKDPLILAVSMGGLLALNLARAITVKALALMYPATNLQAVHDGTGGAADGHVNVEAAYGGLAAFNAAKAAHDPAQHASDFTGKPIRMYRSTADTVVGSANQDAFAAAVGGSALSVVGLGAAGHADMTQIPVDDLTAFIAANA